jgi:uncharacterized membrane protein YfcA
VSQKSVGNRRYVLLFSMIYAAGQVAGYLLLYLLHVKSITLILTAVLVGAAFYTAIRFVRENQRPPDNQEKWRLAGGSLIASIALSLTLGVVAILLMEPSGALALMLDELGKYPAWAWMLIGAVIAGVYGIFLLLLYFIYGFVAMKYFERRHPRKYARSTRPTRRRTA